MTCLEVQELLSPYMDEVLDADELHLVEKHIAHCSICRAELASLEQTVLAIRALVEIEPPPDFSMKLRQRLVNPGNTSKKAFYKSIGRWNWMPLGAAAALLMIMVLSWNLFGNPATYMQPENEGNATLQADGAFRTQDRDLVPSDNIGGMGGGLSATDEPDDIKAAKEADAPQVPGERSGENTGTVRETSAAPSTQGESKGAPTGEQVTQSSPGNEFFSLSVPDKNYTQQSGQPTAGINTEANLAKSTVVTLVVADRDLARQQLQLTSQQYNGLYSDKEEKVLLDVPRENFDAALASLENIGETTESEVTSTDLSGQIQEAQIALEQLNEKLNAKGLTKAELDRLRGEIVTWETLLNNLNSRVSWSLIEITLQSKN